jgi:hypothetical protein
MELCGEHVITLIAGASWISCALDKGHEGGHRGKGDCFRHGEYFGDVGAFPQCPQYPTCIQNLTADELKHSYSEPEDSPELAQIMLMLDKLGIPTADPVSDKHSRFLTTRLRIEKLITMYAELRRTIVALEFQLAEADFDFGGWRAIKKRLEDDIAEKDARIAELEKDREIPWTDR